MRNAIFILPILSAFAVNSCSRPEKFNLRAQPRYVSNANVDTDVVQLTSSIALPASTLALASANTSSVSIAVLSAKGVVEGYNDGVPADLDKLDDTRFGLKVPRRFANASIQFTELNLVLNGESFTITKEALVSKQGMEISFDGQIVAITKRRLQTRIVVRSSDSQASGEIAISGLENLCFDPIVQETSNNDRDLISLKLKLGKNWEGMINSHQPASAIFNGLSKAGTDTSPSAEWLIDIEKLKIGDNEVLLAIEDEASSRCEIVLNIEVQEDAVMPSSRVEQSRSPSTVATGFASPFGDADGTLASEFQSMDLAPGVDLFRGCPEKINVAGFSNWQKILLMDPMNPERIGSVECWVMNSFCIDGEAHGLAADGGVIGMTYEELTLPFPDGWGLKPNEVIEAATADCSERM